MQNNKKRDFDKDDNKSIEEALEDKLHIEHDESSVSEGSGEDLLENASR
jgi:hypothetical protein